MGFSVRQFTDPQAYFTHIKPVLLKHEATNNMFFGCLQGAPSFDEHAFFLSIHLGQKYLGGALRTHGHQHMLITSLPTNATQFLATYLAERHPDLQGIMAPQKTADVFRQNWQTHTNKTSKLAVQLGLFSAHNAVSLPDTIKGRATLATSAHKSVFTDFCLGFIEDCFPDEQDKPEKAEQLATRHIKNQTAFLWLAEDGTPVAMAALQRTTPHMAAISLVYTPPKHRGHGYAKCIVAALTNKLLATGYKKCLLFADLHNNITPDFYKKLGYRHTETLPRYAFE